MRSVFVAAAMVVWMLSGCAARTQGIDAGAPPQLAGDSIDAYAAIVASPDRAEEDRQLDVGRAPAEMLRFFGVHDGMRIAELGAGGGYTTELLARSVGPQGAVYGQNSPVILERFAEAPWRTRLQKPQMKNVTRVDREFDEPLPPEVAGLDAVLIVLFYHDTVWMNVDRARMNRAIFEALKPGGVYGVIDHSSWPGRGTSEVQTLHRIDEQLVRAEIEAAGFELADQAFFLRNPEDKRDWNASPRSAGELRGTSDRFVLKFVKPSTESAAVAPATPASY
jgi:predicted methyltransferase